ncbi:hypothetical protein KSX_58750 [Ktedonospora formicarum]|uniref:Uncharacterized protein n=1 Tax=Ktedonospora formicarum TaxID=2778364 RepID=A0A8J3MT15_9CHLR|nr:hypothetical protein KSX_58750 [Ktedonospora formicarum]
MVVYGLWTMQLWAFWMTACYEATEILYEGYLLTQSEYRGLLHMAGPLVGILMSAITLGYLFLDRTMKPVFSRQSSVS